MAGRKGFTLMEMIIVTVIMGVFAALTIPRLSFSAVNKKQAETAVRRFVTDLRRTRSLAIRDAATHSNGFRLKLAGNPSSSYDIIDRDSGETLETHSFDSAISIAYSGGDQNLDFGPLGNLATSSADTITISGYDKSYTVTIVYSTGSTRFSESGS